MFVVSSRLCKPDGLCFTVISMTLPSGEITLATSATLQTVPLGIAELCLLLLCACGFAAANLL